MDYKLHHFEKANAKGKKYSAILRNSQGREKRVNFGSLGHQHYKDSTGKGLYTHLNHLDPQRRKNFRNRFKNMAKRKNSAAYFAYHYLW